MEGKVDQTVDGEKNPQIKLARISPLLSSDNIILSKYIIRSNMQKCLGRQESKYLGKLLEILLHFTEKSWNNKDNVIAIWHSCHSMMKYKEHVRKT